MISRSAKLVKILEKPQSKTTQLLVQEVFAADRKNLVANPLSSPQRD